MPIQRKALFDLLNLFYEHSIHIDNDVLNKYNSIIDKWICLSLPHIIFIFPSHLSNDVLTDLLSDKTYFINENEKKKWVKVLILTRSRRTIQLTFFDRIYIFIRVANSMVEYSAFKCDYNLLHIWMKQRIRPDYW